MSETIKKVLVKKEILRKYFIELLTRKEIDIKDAEIAVDILIEADLRGTDTHGVLRLLLYLKRIDLGLMSKENNIEIVSENSNFAIIDGGNYIGQIAAKYAMDKAIEKATDNTIGMALVRNNNHYGACSYYALMPVNHDMIGFTTSNTVPLMAPSGGKRRIIGNNPFAFAAPAGKYRPFAVDIATSTVAAGRIQLARKNEQEIPYGWALNKDGLPTTNAFEGFEGGGMLLPVGSHKGYGMAVMFDILSGILSGGAFGSQVKSMEDYLTKEPLGTCHMMMAINIDKIIGIKNFKNSMDTLIGEIKNCPKAEGIREIFIPGEIEFNTYDIRSKEGIPISIPVLNDINKAGREVNLGNIV